MAWSASRPWYGNASRPPDPGASGEVKSDAVVRPDGRLRRGHADAASRVRHSDSPAAPAHKDKRHMPRTAYESGEPLPGQCRQPPPKTPATAASPTIRSAAATGHAGNQSSEPEADTAIKPAHPETNTGHAGQRPVSVNAEGGEMGAPQEPEPSADPLNEWKTTQTSYYRQRRRDAEGRLSEWTPKLCAGAFGTTLYLGANLAGPPEWTELLGAAWTCWILGLLTWYASGLTAIKANDTAVNNISRVTTGVAAEEVAAKEDVCFGPWNKGTRWLDRLTGFLLLTGVVFALAFAWINIGKIGGPNDHTESGSDTDNTATATPRHTGTAGTDADTASEDPSSVEPAKEMRQPDTTDDWLSHRKIRIAHTAIMMTCNRSKSAWKCENHDRLPEHYFDHDSIASGIRDSNSESARARAREYINDQINQATDARRDFGTESTYLRRPRRAMVEHAKAASCRVEGLYIGTDSPEINAERIRPPGQEDDDHRRLQGRRQ